MDLLSLTLWNVQVRDVIQSLSDSGGRVNPFVAGRFFFTVEARWPPELEHGLLMMTTENLGEHDLPAMRIAAPAHEKL